MCDSVVSSPIILVHGDGQSVIGSSLGFIRATMTGGWFVSIVHHCHVSVHGDRWSQFDAPHLKLRASDVS
jgi:hypothetical protein